MALEENCILNQIEINHKIKRIAYQIYECNVNEQEIIIAGIYSNGYLFAKKIKSAIEEISNINPLLCKVKLIKTNLQVLLLHLLVQKITKENPWY